MTKRGPGPGPKIQCIHCEGVVQSMHRHDFKSCPCGRIAIDGGGWYTKILFKEEGDYLSVEESE